MLIVTKSGEVFPAKSILAVLSAGLDQGTTFILKARGPDAQAAAELAREVVTLTQPLFARTEE